MEKAESMGMEGRGGGVTGGKTGGCVLRGESDRVSEVSLWGEQLDWGAATLPTLSSLSRINDDVRPIRIHERAGLLCARAWPPHTCTHSHRLTHSLRV